MNNKTKTCRDCGATFKRSPADRTVRCPDCRKPATATAPASSPIVVCNCGKTVIIDGFGSHTGNTCPRNCG